jgi:iron-sulfur cluster assembly accessory protein
VGCQVKPVGVPIAKPVVPVVELTDAARAEFHRLAAELAPEGPCYLRLTIAYGGCTGFQSKLDLDPTQPGPADVSVGDGDVTVVYSADQTPLVQGAVIDFVSTEEKRGFSVTFPNKSDLNQRLTREWLQEEARKRGDPVPEFDGGPVK